MNYDELEEKYYILTQRVADLERSNTSLTARNNDLEAQNIVLENSMVREEAKTQSLAKAFQDETYKSINLKVRLETVEKERDKWMEKANSPEHEENASLVRRALMNDPFELQRYANWRDQAVLPVLPGYSVHLPMGMVDVSSASKSIVLHATDHMGFSRDWSPMDGTYHFHAMAKMGDRVVRYSTQSSMFDLMRREDFAVALHQMTQGLQEQIIHEYSKRDF